MAYPSLEQYQETLQHPASAFADPLLAKGRIRTSGLGLPVVVSGGFALTYAVELSPGKKYAVRCFHREAKDLERRYAAISRKLQGLNSSYFVDFEFQPRGVKVGSAQYPVVKMAWAEGETLGEFVEGNYSDRAKLTQLLASLTLLAEYLEKNGIAHGDLQEGNLMVADGGRRLQLIDYDGMFVPEIASLGGSEMGHRDYQHPNRGPADFDAKLDRFSFISLNLALRALCERPSLWNSSQSGAGVILFRANDFKDPGASPTLSDIRQIPSLARDAQNFLSVCAGRISDVPALRDFLAGTGIPSVKVEAVTSRSQARAGYISQYPVLNAGDYAAFARSIGRMVELVGKVVDVSESRSKYGKPYIFVNFAPWTGKCVKLAIWSDALGKGGNRPTKAWVGKWVTIRGLVEPVYSNPKFKYEHISITVAALSQISELTQGEAQYRLEAPTRTTTAPTAPSARTNQEVLEGIRLGASGAARPTPASGTGGSVTRGATANQQLLDNIRQQSRQSTPPGTGARPAAGSANRPVGVGQPHYKVPPTSAPKSSGVPWWVWVLGAIVFFVLTRR
ncbi:protein kinase family protein [Aromatoleum toluclasticum]|uniref:protein kinase family protein n=1 Tax=Aromatoleum toluclasticum TaxID=92003 RepID=UPI0003718BF3|nr:protein kinase family protein [Aromatoleum toluclasticum]